MDRDYEWVVADPILGDVSCDDEEHAIDYARAVEGTVKCRVWEDGAIVDVIASSFRNYL